MCDFDSINVPTHLWGTEIKCPSCGQIVMLGTPHDQPKAEPPDCCTGEVCDLPKTLICSHCFGSGEGMYEGAGKCIVCGGGGRVPDNGQ